MADTITAPTKQLSAPKLGGRWTEPSLTEREEAAALKWPRSVRKTFPAMLTDAQLDGQYRGMTLPIRALDYRLDPNGARPELVEHAAATFGLDILGQPARPRRRTQRRFIFDEHLEDVLRFVVDGHRHFEIVAEATQTDGGENGGWRQDLRKLFPITPDAIQRIQPAPDGSLQSLRVPALDRNASGPIPGFVDVEVDRLVAYVWDPVADATTRLRGRSMMRSCYRPWRLKDRVMRVGAINIERAGGTPYATAPEGAGQAQVDEINALITQFRAGDEAGLTLPYGATLKFASAAGGEQAVNFVKLQNEEMARAWLAQWMLTGQTGTGSRSAADSMIDYLRLGQQAVAGRICDVFSRHVIEDWVEWNYGPDEEYAPLLVFVDRNQDEDVVAPVADALEEAAGEGTLPDDSIASALKRGGGARRRVAPKAATVTLPDRELRREPNAAEMAAAVDFAEMEQVHADALEDLVKDWKDVRSEQVAALSELIEAADGDVAVLASLQVDPAGAEVISAALRKVAAQGIDAAHAEAKTQGVTIKAPEVDDVMGSLDARAEATATLLSRALSEVASRKAVEFTSPTSTPAAVAAQVVEHIEGLSDAYLEEQFGGVLSQGQLTGRRAVMAEAPKIAKVYASAILDANTCGPCAENDGREYDSLEDAEQDFPTGGYAHCEGGPRDRCTLVAVYDDEATPSVQ